MARISFILMFLFLFTSCDPTVYAVVQNNTEKQAEVVIKYKYNEKGFCELQKNDMPQSTFDDYDPLILKSNWVRKEYTDIDSTKDKCLKRYILQNGESIKYEIGRNISFYPIEYMVINGKKYQEYEMKSVFKKESHHIYVCHISL